MLGGLIVAFTAGLQVPPDAGRRSLITAASLAALSPPASDAAEDRAQLPVFGSGGRVLGRQEIDLAAQYAANPADLSGLSLPPGCAGATNVFLVFHGRGGPDRETDDLLARVRAQDAAAKFSRTVTLFDWRNYFENDAARISFAGQAVGRRLGRALFAEAPNLRTLHVVGTSAGAWPSTARTLRMAAMTASGASSFT